MTFFGKEGKFGKSFFNTDMMLCSEKQTIDRLRDMKEEMEQKFQKVFLRMAKCVNFKIKMIFNSYYKNFSISLVQLYK